MTLRMARVREVTLQPARVWAMAVTPLVTVAPAMLAVAMMALAMVALLTLVRPLLLLMVAWT